MKLRRIDYDDEQELSAITVSITRAEAIALLNIVGQLNGNAAKKLGLTADDNLYDVLAGVFNGEDEDGYPNLGVDLATINAVD